MPKTIKGKILTGLILTSIVSMVITNIIIWKVFENNLYSFIENDMDKTKTIVLSEIKMRYPVGNEIDLINNKNELWSILNNINSGYNTYASLNKSEESIGIFAGEVIDEKIIEVINEEDNKLSSLLYIHKDGDNYYATFTYPLYISDNYNGTLVFQKSYLPEFTNYLELLKIIVLIQSIVYTIMIIAMYIILKKTTRPLKNLTIAMTAFENGDSFNLTIKTKDEVATLMNQFNKMQVKIIDQMEYLKLEKIRIEELEKSSRDFFNYATHELKTPITSIKGYTQLLQGGDLDVDVIERAYERIWIESERMYALIQNILMVAKGKEVPTKEAERIDLEQLTREVIGEYNLIYHKNEMYINIIRDINMICDSDETMIFGVKEEIRTIIVNLLNNAVKYSANNKISITCTSNDKVCFIIENKCLPIPYDIQNKLFEPFIKYNYEDYTKVSSGLGLFICKELAERNYMNLSYNLVEDKIRFELSI